MTKPLSPELMAMHRVKNILRESWYHPDHGREGPCLVDAINMAAPWEAQDGELRYHGELRYRVRMAFEKYATSENGLVRWNDKPGRTHAEVMDLCEKVILDEERRQALAGGKE